MIRVGDRFVWNNKHAYYLVKMDRDRLWLSMDKNLRPRPNTSPDWNMLTATRIAAGDESTRENWTYIPAYPSHVQLPEGV